MEVSYLFFISDSPVIKGRVQILDHDSDLKLKIIESCKNSKLNS